MSTKMRISKKVLSLLILVTLLVSLSLNSEVKASPSYTSTQLTISFSPSNIQLAGDIYVDGKLHVSGANKVGVEVTAGSHLVEAKNIKDRSNRSGDTSYYWKDVSKTVTVSSGKNLNVTLKPEKVYTQGYLTVTCTFKTYKKSTDYPLKANINVDGTNQGACTPENSKWTIVLNPGAHSVEVKMDTTSPYKGAKWTPSSVKQSVNISAGKTTTLGATFTPK